MQDKKEINVEIGRNIRIEREKAGLTQDQLSELIGIWPKSLSAIERGTVGVSIQTLKKICDVLAVSSDDLLFGRREKNQVQEIVAKLERLSPKQCAIVGDVVCKMIEAFCVDADK